MKTLAAKVMIVFAALFVLAMANIFLPVLRFSNQRANQATAILVFGIPLILTLLSFLIPNKWAKLVIVLGLLPVVGLCFVFQFFLLTDLQIDGTPQYRSFDPISSVAANGTQIVAYRTDGGATTDFGIVVRQQRRLVPGLLVVRDLYREYHAHDAHLELAGPNSVRVVMDRADGTLTFPVRRFVWF